MKKILLSFILIFALSFFCGCAQSQNAYEAKGPFVISKLAFLPQGEIVQTLGVSVDKENLEKFATPQEQTSFVSNLVDEVDKLRQRFLLSYALVYVKNPLQEMRIGVGVKISQSAYRQERDVVAFDVMFSSISAWRYYHNINSQDDAKEEGAPLFFSQSSNSSVFPFATKTAEGEIVGERFAKMYLNAASGLSFETALRENYKPTFIYNYSTPSSRLKSDADFVFKDEYGQYNHVWLESKQSLTEECKTTIYYNEVNKGMWILLTLSLSLVGLAIYLFLYKIRLKNN